jgi:acyl carrier protein
MPDRNRPRAVRTFRAAVAGHIREAVVVISRTDFISLIRDELKLPLANADLESDFDQRLSWRSIHVVRLAVQLEKRTGRKIPIADLFDETTPAGIYDLMTTRWSDAA